MLGIEVRGLKRADHGVYKSPKKSCRLVRIAMPKGDASRNEILGSKASDKTAAVYTLFQVFFWQTHARTDQKSLSGNLCQPPFFLGGGVQRIHSPSYGHL